MRASLFDISLHKIGLITIGIIWMLNSIGILPQLQPYIVIYDADRGFYITYVGIYILIWVIIYFVERSYSVPLWLARMRSHAGTTRVVDMLIVALCLFCGSVAFKDGILSPLLICIVITAFVGAIHSLIRGGRRARRSAALSAMATSP